MSTARIKRFTPVQKAFHFLLLATFLIQAATGLGRMYTTTGFGQALNGLFGGFDASLVVHKWVGMFMLVLFALHVIYVAIAVLPRVKTGPDSMFPRPRDFGDLLRHVRWMIGAGKPPSFERWTYWEKFDYWAVFWGMVVLGGTGVLLWNPLLTSRYLEGWGLNVAFWIHRIEAVLAILHVFIIHFLISHLRVHTFPMDRAMFAGDTSLEVAHHERADWLQRLRGDNRMEPLLKSEASTSARAVSMAVGLAAVLCGLIMLIGGLAYAPLVNW